MELYLIQNGANNRMQLIVQTLIKNKQNHTSHNKTLGTITDEQLAIMYCAIKVLSVEQLQYICLKSWSFHKAYTNAAVVCH